MKKLVLAAVAASVVATSAIASPAAAAPFDRNDRGRNAQVDRSRNTVEQGDRYRVRQRQVAASRAVPQRNWQSRNWRKGERFDSRYARNYREIRNPRAYNLYDAPRGYRWVQSDNEAVLVAIVSGLVGAVIGNAL